MNENLNLVEILKDCPRGTKLYSTIFGEVIFDNVAIGKAHPIVIRLKDGSRKSFSAEGKLYIMYDGECTLFPRKNQRDWSKFTAPWDKKERFDPKTLRPFDKVLVRYDSVKGQWRCTLFSHIIENEKIPYRFVTSNNAYEYCIPYNEDTKHLAGTCEEAPEYYRYWED